MVKYYWLSGRASTQVSNGVFQFSNGVALLALLQQCSSQLQRLQWFSWLASYNYCAVRCINAQTTLLQDPWTHDIALVVSPSRMLDLKNGPMQQHHHLLCGRISRKHAFCQKSHQRSVVHDEWRRFPSIQCKSNGKVEQLITLQNFRNSAGFFCGSEHFSARNAHLSFA